ncbi:MAG: hypothetical protein WAW37_12350 [Syntrophobacteraceae bacterium]
MAKAENATTITIYLDDEVQLRLKTMAQRVKISRNRLALNLLIIGLEEAEFLGAFVKLARLARTLKKNIRNKVWGTEATPKIAELWEKPEKSKTMTIYLSNDLLDRLDKVCEITGITRNMQIVNLLIIGLEESEALWKMGVIQVTQFAMELRLKIREKISGATEE